MHMRKGLEGLNVLKRTTSAQSITLSEKKGGRVWQETGETQKRGVPLFRPERKDQSRHWGKKRGWSPLWRGL